MRDALSRRNTLLSFCLAPHAPYTVSDRSFEQIVDLRRRSWRLPIHIHLHETVDEIRESVTRFGVRPLERLRRLGLLGPGLIAVHAVHLTTTRNRPARATQAPAWHIAQSRISSSRAESRRSRRFAERGVNVGRRNGRRGKQQPARPVRGDAAGGAARQGRLRPRQPRTGGAALHMATLGAARALGLDDAIGSIAPGKLADLIAVNLEPFGSRPCYHPISHLVYAAGARGRISRLGRRPSAAGPGPPDRAGRSDSCAPRHAAWQTRMARKHEHERQRRPAGTGEIQPARPPLVGSQQRIQAPA